MNTDGAETKLIPAGVYLLGSSATDTMAFPPEQPQHKVDLSGFYIYTHEVTNAMYQKCADAGTCLPVTAIRDDLSDYYGNDTYKEFPCDRRGLEHGESLLRMGRGTPAH